MTTDTFPAVAPASSETPSDGSPSSRFTFDDVPGIAWELTNAVLSASGVSAEFTISINRRAFRWLGLTITLSPGRFRIEFSERYIRKAVLLQDIVTLTDTIVHEAAHIVQTVKYPRSWRDSHGRYWRGVMLSLGFSPSVRIDDVSYYIAPVEQRRYSAACGCGAITGVSGKRRSLMLRGRTYLCSKCHLQIFLTNGDE